MSTTNTYISEDKGDKNENKILWYSLDGSTTKICPFTVQPKRPVGCQYVNPHNVQILKAFNFNTNIRIGDVLQVFYSTLYTSKSTQDEDSEKRLRIGCAVIKRIKRILDENSDECNKATSEPSFDEGLSRVLSGLNAATTRNVISAAMVHFILLNGGSHFVFLHKFSDLLVGQMEATLQGQEINVQIRTIKLADGQSKSWSDSLADDYIHWPQSAAFEAMSFFELTRHYKKVFKPLQRDSEDNVQFSVTHPGHKFSHLKRSKRPTIPRIALPKRKLCPIRTSS
jgi:hypothetical protein